MRYVVDIEDCDYGNGICLACGEIQWGGCEPDARNYECESCGKNRVYGLEEAIIGGYVDADPDAIARLMLS
jgi:hypothetical protein